MRIIDCGISGDAAPYPSVEWSELELAAPWPAIIRALNPGCAPRPAQVEALAKLRVLETRRNLIVSAPTNAGKSLIGLLILLDAVHRGRRAVLLEPLRALAREKADELEAVVAILAEALGVPFNIQITTGDYRMDDETFSAQPPDRAELIVATPERLEAILRNPRNDGWIESIGAVCVDEAHLISSPRRGPTLEYLLTSLLCLPAPPRMVLLSATLGNVDRAQNWLSPCDTIQVRQRHPPLRKQVIELGPDDDANLAVVDLAKDALADPSANLLVFVYQTRATERLAELLRERAAECTGAGPLAYHSQMSFAQREAVRQALRSGASRCVVSTTALGLGVNLPATHVVVRDPTFPGVGRVGIGDLLQMMGRAGRGDQAGSATVLVRPGDGWAADNLAQALRTEAVQGLVSQFELPSDARSRPFGPDDDLIVNAATQVAAQLAKRTEEGLSVDDLRRFFDRSLGANALADRVSQTLAWLSDPSRALSFREDSGRNRLTVLGLNATRSVLPLSVAAGFGQLMRDLLSADRADGLLAQWQPLDHLVVLDLLRQRAPRLRPFSEELAEQVDAWMEAVPGRSSFLYREWLAGEAGNRAEEVLGSLGIRPNGPPASTNSAARKAGYAALFRSMVMFDRGLGIPSDELERRWKVTGLDGIEERWRDELLWLLSGVASTLDVRCFFFHLREDCGADRDRIRRVKRLLGRIRAQTFDLREHLKYCSPLGPILRSVKRTGVGGDGAKVGFQTIRRLEAAGISSLTELARMQLSDLVRLGVRRDLAKQITIYVRRRHE